MIEADGHQLKIHDLWQVAHRRDKLKLADSAREPMRQSRALVEKVAAEPRAVYGINTGFGPLSGTRISPRDLQQHQLNLLHHLSVGQGALFSAVETRAIMAARANALARGFSGIRPEVVELLIAALNCDILPEIPCEGSVGPAVTSLRWRTWRGCWSVWAMFAWVRNGCPPPRLCGSRT